VTIARRLSAAGAWALGRPAVVLTHPSAREPEPGDELVRLVLALHTVGRLATHQGNEPRSPNNFNDQSRATTAIGGV
jgi:hypothetical protein